MKTSKQFKKEIEKQRQKNSFFCLRDQIRKRKFVWNGIANGHWKRMKKWNLGISVKRVTEIVLLVQQKRNNYVGLNTKPEIVFAQLFSLLLSRGEERNSMLSRGNGHLSVCKCILKLHKTIGLQATPPFPLSQQHVESSFLLLIVKVVDDSNRRSQRQRRSKNRKRNSYHRRIVEMKNYTMGSGRSSEWKGGWSGVRLNKGSIVGRSRHNNFRAKDTKGRMMITWWCTHTNGRNRTSKRRMCCTLKNTTSWEDSGKEESGTVTTGEELTVVAERPEFDS